jgi:hypothetical protein
MGEKITRESLIAQIKKENPKMVATIEGEKYELTPEEYEEAATNWAEMRIQQIEAESK